MSSGTAYVGPLEVDEFKGCERKADGSGHFGFWLELYIPNRKTSAHLSSMCELRSLAYQELVSTRSM